jgi:dTDP-4-dehydrorhamnose 3,5-epimerase-like enzyme
MHQTIIPLGPSYKDARGTIQMVLETQPINSVSIIESKAGSTRAGHWHKQDSHFCLVTKGSIWYYERPSETREKVVLNVVKEGELFYTPPRFDHEMYFSEDTVFHCYSTLSRANADYENDTVRLTTSLKAIYDSQ